MIVQRAKWAGIEPWELAGLPETKNTIFWSMWIGIVAEVEIDAREQLRKQEEARNRAARGF